MITKYQFTNSMTFDFFLLVVVALLLLNFSFTANAIRHIAKTVGIIIKRLRFCQQAFNCQPQVQAFRFQLIGFNKAQGSAANTGSNAIARSLGFYTFSSYIWFMLNHKSKQKAQLRQT